MDNTCKTCEYFERSKWHKSQGGGFQKGGIWQKLFNVFKIDNANLIFVDELYVRDSFGCILYKSKK